MTPPSPSDSPRDPARASSTAGSSSSPEVGATITQLAGAGLPLESGLRAAAIETSDPRLASALRDLAAALERGESLDAASTHLSGLIAPIRYVLQARTRDDRPSVDISEMVLAQSFSRSLVRSIGAAMAYPAILLVLTGTVFVLFQFGVTQPINVMINEFELAIPAAMGLLLWWGNAGIWFFLAFVLVMTICLLALRFFAPRTLWHRILMAIPFFGSIFQWAATAQLARTTSLLMRVRAPMPEALRLTAGALDNAYLAQRILRLAAATQQGTPLDKAVRAESALPPTLAPWIAWGLQADQVSEGWEAAASMFEERVRIRTELLRVVFPPIVFVCIAFIVIVLVSTVSLPTFVFLRFLG